MIEIVDHLIPDGELGLKVMMLTTLIMIILVAAAFIPALRLIYGIYKNDRIKMESLVVKTSEHEKLMLITNQRIEMMLQEMKNNRAEDNKRSNITHQLVLYMAKKNKIDLPDL